MRKLDEGAEAERVKADLLELDRLRRYLIFGTQARSSGNRGKLIKAINDCVAEIIGDRTTLHGKNHSVDENH